MAQNIKLAEPVVKKEVKEEEAPQKKKKRPSTKKCTKSSRNKSGN